MNNGFLRGMNMFSRFTLIGLFIFLLAVAGYGNVVAQEKEELDPADPRFIEKWTEFLADPDNGLTQEHQELFSDPKTLEFLKQKLGIRTPWTQEETNEKAKEAFSDPQVRELALAASGGDIQKIDELVGDGVDVNARGKDNMTPLLWVLNTKSIDGFQRLLEHGADPNIAYKERSSVMSFLAKGNEPKLLKLALDYGGDANTLIGNNGNKSIIFSAITHGKVENAKLLIDAGADLDFQNRVTGETPLHATGISRQYQIAYLLLEAGADPRINKKNGKNSLLYAIEKTQRPGSDEIYQWRQKVIEYLRAAGMEIDPKYP